MLNIHNDKVDTNKISLIDQNILNTTIVFDEVKKLVSAGLSLHWLSEGTKQPIGKGWQEAPNKSYEDLFSSHRPRLNLGCRTGEWSSFPDGTCLIVLDVDLKGGSEYREIALSHVKKILGEELSIYPHVNSPRGIHYYARCNLEHLLPNQNIAKSDNLCKIEMDGELVSRNCWEVDFLSTSKQIVIPPSIHPDTKTAYQWGKRFDSFLDIPLLPIEFLAKLKKGNNQAASDNVVSLNNRLVTVDLESVTVPLELPQQLRSTIIHGVEKGKRSETIFAVAKQLLRLGISEYDIVSILTDPAYKISEKSLEKGDRFKAAEWVSRYCLATAKKEIKASKGSDPIHLTSCTISDFIKMELPPRDLILAPWLPTAGLCMIHARPGIGKTHLSFGIAYAVAMGGQFLKWKAEKPRGVLVIDGELSAPLAQERWKLIEKMQGQKLAAPLLFVTPDLQEGGMPDLGTDEGQAAINELITDEINLIIVDNLSCLVRTGKENESDSWLPVQTWALNLRAKGKSVLFIHHSGKGGSQRGSSKKEDVLDSVISLKRPENYTQDKGATFEVHFEKARGFCGDEAQPFEASLMQNENGLPCWVTRSLEESTFDKVVSLLNKGMSQKDITLELGVNKSTVSRHAVQAKQSGVLKARISAEKEEF